MEVGSAETTLNGGSADQVRNITLYNILFYFKVNSG